MAGAAKAARSALFLLVLQLEDLPLGLGQLQLHLGGLLQVLLELAAQILGGLHLLEVLVGNVDRRQDGPIHQGHMGSAQNLLHLGVHVGGHLLGVARLLGAHQRILLSGDGDGDTVFHGNPS